MARKKNNKTTKAKQRKLGVVNLVVEVKPGPFSDELLAAIKGDDPYDESWIGFIKKKDVFSKGDKMFTTTKVVDEDDEFLYCEPVGERLQHRLVKINKDKLIKIT